MLVLYTLVWSSGALLAAASLQQPRPHPRFLAKVAAIPHIGKKSKAVAAAAAVVETRNSSTLLFPCDYGADPTGKADSLPAFRRVLAAAWRPQPSGQFTNGPDNSAIIDLQGGTYLLSAPLLFPAAGGGGVSMRDGVIRASSSFPMDNSSALLMLTATNASGADDSACCWYEFIYFSNLVLDASLRSGCARVEGATRITFDTVFFTGYRTTGLYYGEPSHQLLLTRSFFGTSDWRGLPGAHDVCETMSHQWQNVGLHVAGPDNQLEDSVFFCSGIGIKLEGSSNYFEGIHAFTGAATHYPLGAVYVPAKGASDRPGASREGQHGNRFVHCYWDYSGVRIENPTMVRSY